MTKKQKIEALSTEEIKELIENFTTFKDLGKSIFNNELYKVDQRDKKIFIEIAKLRNLNIEKLERRERTSPIWKVSVKEFKRIINESNSIEDILSYFDMKTEGSNYRTLKERFILENLDYDNFLNKKKNLKLIKEKENIPYICSICKQEGFWMGKPMPLKLDFIDKNKNNHDINNIRFLCANCYSQENN